MSRVVSLLLLLFVAPAACAAELPPGALVRLGDDRFRAGGEILHLAVSPDGKQFATTRNSGCATLVLTVWDAITGQPIRSHEINDVLFQGLAWGPRGGFAIVLRGEPGQGEKRAKVIPDDFRVWEFTDPKAKAPPQLPAGQVGLSGFQGIEGDWPEGGAQYTDFQISADGSRLAARWESGRGKHAVHVFELKQADSAAKLTRLATLDLGAEGADEIRISAAGKTVVTFRALANHGEMTATTWSVATGQPAKPVRVAGANRLMVTPDARSLVVFHDDELWEWGFDQYDLATGEKRRLTRWKYDRDQSDRPSDLGGFTFAPSGRELVVACGWKTHVIDLAAGKERGRLEGHATVPFDRNPILTAVSADGTRIATADEAGLIRLWDAKTLRSLNEAAGHRAPVEHAELSPDGKRLLTWAEDETVRLWDLATGKELRAFSGASGVWHNRDAPTFTPDGTAVLYSTTKRLIARDLQTGLEVPLPGDMKELPPRFAVFSPDGKRVLTWSIASDNYTNRTCEVWEWPGGKKRAAWKPALSRDPFSPGFSPDSSVIFEHPTLPKRWAANTGKELPAAWTDDRFSRDSLLASLRPNQRWLIDYADDAPRVFEVGADKPLSRFRLTYAEDGHPRVSGWGLALAPTGGLFACQSFPVPNATFLGEAATGDERRTLKGHRGYSQVLGFTPDGTKLLTAGGDHTVLVWDMRLQAVPLPESLKKETDAAKLWSTMATGKAKDAYLAMARLAREPDAAIKLLKMKMKPAAKGERETDATILADARTIELLVALDTPDSRSLLKELAAGHPDAFRTQEAKRALERNGK